MPKERLAIQMEPWQIQIQDHEMSNQRFRSPEHTFVQMYTYGCESVKHSNSLKKSVGIKNL